MTLEEAIMHCEEVADGQTEQGKCPECAMEHRQLAEWLTGYKRLKEREPCEDCVSRKKALKNMDWEKQVTSMSDSDPASGLYNIVRNDEDISDYQPTDRKYTLDELINQNGNSYQQGLKLAWETARKVVDLWKDTYTKTGPTVFEELFGDNHIAKVFDQHPSEVFSKICDYEYKHSKQRECMCDLFRKVFSIKEG